MLWGELGVMDPRLTDRSYWSKPPRGDSFQALPAHRGGHCLPVDAGPVPGQRGLDPWRSVGPVLTLHEQSGPSRPAPPAQRPEARNLTGRAPFGAHDAP
jgi:hypothetical protein